jgi:hypothetical protein
MAASVGFPDQEKKFPDDPIQLHLRNFRRASD